MYLPIIHTDRAQIIKPFLKFLLPIQVALDMSKGQVKVIYNLSCVARLICRTDHGDRNSARVMYERFSPKFAVLHEINCFVDLFLRCFSFLVVSSVYPLVHLLVY